MGDDRGIIRVTKQSGLVTVEMAGEFDISTARPLIVALEANASAERLRVDLTDVTFVDSITLGALLKAQHRRQANHARTIVLILPEESPIQRIFEITGFARSFVVEPRREESGRKAFHAE